MCCLFRCKNQLRVLFVLLLLLGARLLTRAPNLLTSPQCPAASTSFLSLSTSSPCARYSALSLPLSLSPSADVDFGNQVLGRDYFQFWDRARVRSTYATPRYYDGVYDPDSFHFHSLNYALEVAADARAAGAAIHEQSPAAAVDLLSDGRKRVSTLAGPSVTADHVVMCGSAYLPSLGGNVGSGAAARVRRAVLPGEEATSAGWWSVAALKVEDSSQSTVLSHAAASVALQR